MSFAEEALAAGEQAAPYLRFAAAFGAAHAVAFAWGPLLALKSRARFAAMWLGVLPMLACPLIIPADAPFLRLVSAGASAILSGKMLDFASARPARPLAAYYLLLTTPTCSTLETCTKRLPAGGKRAADLKRLALAVLVFGCSAALLYALLTARPAGVPFFLEHAAKVLALFICVESAVWIVHTAGRLCGWDVMLIVDFALVSRTPAEWWRRYNRMAGAWLAKHVFRRAGGRRHFVRATLITFLASGLLHEYLFGIALMRVQGFQAAFFLLQGIGAAASAGLHRRIRRSGAWVKLLSWAATLCFNLLTSVLFFASLHGIFPGFYWGAAWLS